MSSCFPLGVLRNMCKSHSDIWIWPWGFQGVLVKYSLPWILDTMLKGKCRVIWEVSQWQSCWVQRKTEGVCVFPRVGLPPVEVPMDILCSKSVCLSWLAFLKHLSDAQLGSTSFPQGCPSLSYRLWDLLYQASYCRFGSPRVEIPSCPWLPGDIHQGVVGCSRGMVPCPIFCSHLLLWTWCCRKGPEGLQVRVCVSILYLFLSSPRP